jgi:hypothetical protein
MRLWRLREAGTPSVLWRAVLTGGPAPADGMRFIPSIGVLPLLIGAIESSG